MTKIVGRSVISRAGGLAFFALGLATAALAQAGAPVSGVVLDPVAHPIPRARVQVEGTETEALTDAQGRFRLENVAGTQAPLRVTIIGFRPLTQTVGVGDANLRLIMTPAAVSLNEVVVTGTAGSAQIRSLGNVVGTVDATKVVALTPSRDITQLLNVGESTVSRWIKQRGLPARQVGGQYRVNRSELLEPIREDRPRSRAISQHQPGTVAPCSLFRRRIEGRQCSPGNLVNPVIELSLQTAQQCLAFRPLEVQSLERGDDPEQPCQPEQGGCGEIEETQSGAAVLLRVPQRVADQCCGDLVVGGFGQVGSEQNIAVIAATGARGQKIAGGAQQSA